jgi:hypothetical protein
LHTWRQSEKVWQRFCDRFLKRPSLTVSISFMNVSNSVLWRMAIILKANKVNLFVSSVLFVFCYHSPNFLDTPFITSRRIVVRWRSSCKMTGTLWKWLTYDRSDRREVKSSEFTTKES